jgi:hypothetical protein
LAIPEVLYVRKVRRQHSPSSVRTWHFAVEVGVSEKNDGGAAASTVVFDGAVVVVGDVVFVVGGAVFIWRVFGSRGRVK